MHESVRKAFVQFSAVFEGRVHWMYLDIKGLVTTGVGNLIDPEHISVGLPFFDKTTRRSAKAAEITAEWQMLKGMRELARKGHKACEAITNLRLTDEAIDALVFDRLLRNERVLEKKFTAWKQWPADAQLGVLSMAWAMGAGFTAKWPKFTAACRADDWDAASEHCAMKEAGNPGIIPRNKANKLLFKNAHEVVKQSFDFSTLFYPKSAVTHGVES